MFNRHKERLVEALEAYEWLPFVTITLAALLVLVFLLQQIFDLKNLLGFARVRALTQPWTFVTSSFLHARLEHLGYNLLGLLFFGYLLEVEVGIGRKNLLIIFLLASVAGNFGHAITVPPEIGGMGASDAVLGLVGFFAIVRPTYLFGMFPPIPMLIWAVLYAAVQFVGIFNPQGAIDYGAHLGGLVAGVLFGICWRVSQSRRQKIN